MRWILAWMLAAALAGPVAADPLTLTPKDSLASLVAACKGKRVTLRLRSGQELSGTVREAGGPLVLLAELTGRELFDAAIPLEAIEAVIVRSK